METCEKWLSWTDLEDAGARAEAAYYLRQCICEPRVVDRLGALVFDINLEAAIEAARSLSCADSTRAIELAITGLGAPHPEVRELLLEALGTAKLPPEWLRLLPANKHAHRLVSRRFSLPTLIKTLTQSPKPQRHILTSVLRDSLACMPGEYLDPDDYRQLPNVEKAAKTSKDPEIIDLVTNGAEAARQRRKRYARRLRANLRTGQDLEEDDFGVFAQSILAEDVDSATDAVYTLGDGDRAAMYAMFEVQSTRWCTTCLHVVADGPADNFGWLIELTRRERTRYAGLAATGIQRMAETFWYDMVWSQEERDNVYAILPKPKKRLDWILVDDAPLKASVRSVDR